MLLFSNQTSDGTSSAYTVAGGDYVFLAQGTFGGGTVQLEYRMEDVSNYIDVQDAAFISNGAVVVSLAPGQVRAELSGSSGADLEAALKLVDQQSSGSQTTEYVELLSNEALHYTINVSRSSSAHVRNSNGQWEVVSADSARIHHNTLGETLGLIVEASRKNYLTDSENPASQTVSLPNTGHHTLWMEGSGSVTVSENTATGTGFGTASEGTPVTFNLDSTGSVDVATTGTVVRFQLERRQNKTTYILSPSGSQGTRAVEAVLTDDLSWYDQSGTTFLVEGYGPPKGAPWVPVAICLSDGAGWDQPQNRIDMRVNSSGTLIAEVVVNDTAQASLPLGSLTDKTFFAATFRIAGDSIAASRDGNAVQAASGLTMPTVTQFNIGSKPDTDHWYSPLRKVRAYKGALSDEELQSLSGSASSGPDPDA